MLTSLCPFLFIGVAWFCCRWHPGSASIKSAERAKKLGTWSMYEIDGKQFNGPYLVISRSGARQLALFIKFFVFLFSFFSALVQAFFASGLIFWQHNEDAAGNLQWAPSCWLSVAAFACLFFSNTADELYRRSKLSKRTTPANQDETSDSTLHAGAPVAAQRDVANDAKSPLLPSPTPSLRYDSALSSLSPGAIDIGDTYEAEQTNLAMDTIEHGMQMADLQQDETTPTAGAPATSNALPPPTPRNLCKHLHRIFLSLGGCCLAFSGWLEFKAIEATARSQDERSVWRLSLFVELMLAGACVLHVFIMGFWRRCVPKKIKSCEFSAQPEGCSGWPCAKVGSVVCLSVVLLASSYSATAEVWWDSCTHEPVWAGTTCAQIIFHFVWSLTVLLELDAFRLIICHLIKKPLKIYRKGNEDRYMFR